VRAGLAALLVVGALAGCSGSDDESSDTTTSTTEAISDEVRIGLEAPLTGDQAALGTGMLQGAQLAAEQLNADGGINGKKVTIVPIDDAADPDTGVEAAKAAIDEGLDAVIGPYNSGVGEKTLPLYLDAGLVPLRLTSATSTEGKGFTLQPMTSQIAPMATTAITDWAEAKSVALIFDEGQAYTEAANEAMKGQFADAGVTVTAEVAVEQGADSYADAVDEAVASDPDLVYVITYYPEAGKIAQAMLESDTSAKCLADYGAYDQAYVEAAGLDVAKNCPVVGVPAPDDFPGSEELVSAFTEANETAPGTWAPYAYDSVMVLAAAATEAGGFDAEALTTALAATDGWEGWTGSVTLESPSGNRDPASLVVTSADDEGELHIDQSWATATNFTF
jgi:branched-chain amino acid transport system substrate-binding protein